AGEVSTPSPNHTPRPTYDCGKPQIIYNGDIYANGPAGTMEARYMLGAYIQALLSCQAGVLAEIKAGNGFTAVAMPDQVAADMSASGDAYSQLSTKVKSTGAMAESSAIDKICNDQAPDNTAPNSDQALHKQAVCYLSAARTEGEAAINYLVV